MPGPNLPVEEQRRLVRTWSEAGEALQRLKREALRSQSDEESRRAADDMLRLGGLGSPGQGPERSAGMVEMQRLFSRGHGSRRA